jgi:adenine-specific DNA-methyltransferase
MANDPALREAIAAALRSFPGQPLRAAAEGLFAALGYRSPRTFVNLPSDPAGFLEEMGLKEPLSEGPRCEKALLADWQEAHLLFQLTDEEINAASSSQGRLLVSDAVERGLAQSYLFMAIRLTGSGYTRTRLAAATREINRPFAMPVLVLFSYGDRLTIAIIARRRHRREASQDVLEKVTLIKDISVAAPHRGHIDILHDLALPSLATPATPIQGFTGLQQAWEAALDASVLTRRFYNEVANWYFWALGKVTFPPGAGDEATGNPVSLIRLITRVIFCWFLKEKGLLPEALFDEAALDGVLVDLEPDGSTYYKAILQNLFFATLNQEVDGRAWRKPGQNYCATNLYRYKALFRDPAAGRHLFAGIPFLNGGLFECLDRLDDVAGRPPLRVDGFSDYDKNPLSVPTELFFGGRRSVDLAGALGQGAKPREVSGLVRILKRFKFTVEENTPLEQEVALDPELLGLVFENLLAAYDPETGSTARKASGSYYTPRQVVEYMVDEALVAYLADHLPEGPQAPERLRALLSYEQEDHAFTPGEVQRLVKAIDALRALDPACGSGAFPMGLLHKLVHALRRLDPDNVHWRRVQIERAKREAGEAFAIVDRAARQERLQEIERAFERNLDDYGRKLYLIENCIYGVDIQPIAVQIAKLRFFIALVVDQRPDDALPNRGILPLPNLETRFVAANSLLGVERPVGTLDMFRPEARQIEQDLRRVRRKHFAARRPAAKRKYREQDHALRGRLAGFLRQAGFLEKSAALMAAWDPYDQNAHATFFDPEWMFSLTEGFDVVIGNPPYVRQERIRGQKPALKAQGYACYSGTADLYVYFYERGVRLLREGGVLAYISSNKYMRADYGKQLREYLGAQRIETAIDFGDAPVFEAIAYPSILVLRKGAAPEGHTLRALEWRPEDPLNDFAETVRRRAFRMRQADLGADGWRLASEEVLRLLERLQAAGRPLGEVVGGRMYRGILTGLNAAFVVDTAQRDALVAEDAASADLLRPMLRGQDVKRWRVAHAGLWLIFARRGVDIDRYPAIKRHLEQYRDRLTPGVPGGRKPGAYEWYEIQDTIAYWQEFERPKVVYPDIAPSPQFAYDAGAGYVAANTVYILPDAPPWMVALLNSRAVTWLYGHMSTAIRGGYVRFFSQHMERIPIPDGGAASRLPELAAQALAADDAEAVGALEAEIDAEVYRLYGLTDEEIALIVEGTGG